MAVKSVAIAGSAGLINGLSKIDASKKGHALSMDNVLGTDDGVYTPRPGREALTFVPPDYTPLVLINLTVVDTSVSGANYIQYDESTIAPAVGYTITQGANTMQITAIVDDFVFVSNATGFTTGIANIEVDTGPALNWATFNVANIGSMLANFDASSGTTLAGSTITAWASTVGAISMGVGSRIAPDYSATDADFNNLPSISQSYTGPLTNFQALSSATNLVGSAFTGFIVVKSLNDPAVGPSSSLANDGSFMKTLANTRYPNTSGTVDLGFATNAVKNTGVNPTTPLTNPHITTIVSAASLFTWYMDGTQLYTTGTNTVSAGAAYNTSAGDRWLGKIARMGAFAKALTQAERIMLHQHLSAKYDIALDGND